MKQALYYVDSYTKSFQATVLSCEAHQAAYKVVLTDTAFYPEGGGQPADVGLLGNGQVTHVWEACGVIYHLVDTPLEVGQSVTGTIDFLARMDWMQQHSGEHILSGIIAQQFGFANIGFHMNKEVTTADYDGLLTVADCEQLELAVNEAILANVAITAQIYTNEAVKKETYRAKKELSGDVRLVGIGEYDRCACCGTHVHTTGEIGLFKILGVEKYRQGSRITLVCGKRALLDYQRKQQQAVAISQLLSVKPNEIAAGVTRLQKEVENTKEKVVARTQMFMEAQVHYYNQAQLNEVDEIADTVSHEACTAGLWLVAPGFNSDERRRYCVAMAEATGRICMVVTEEAHQLQYALGATTVDIRPLAKQLQLSWNGKGGGKPALCQGNLQGALEAVRAQYEEAVSSGIAEK